MSGKRIVLVGGGGHCRSVIGLFRDATQELHGILDPAIVGNVLGIPVLGGDERIPELAGLGHPFVVTAGHVRDAALRIRLCTAIMNAGGTLATILAPTSTVVKGATIGEGTTVGHGAVVNSNGRIGTNCIINTRALVEHDALIGDHVHIATGAIVNGHCTVGKGTLIGSGAVVLQGVRIGEGCIIGAGSVVIRDVADGTTVAGVPAKPLKR